MKKYTEENLRQIVNESKLYREVLIKFERNQSGASYKTLHRRLKEWNIDISHFLTKNEMMKQYYEDKSTIFIKKVMKNYSQLIIFQEM